jgi:hypothetical protein
MGPCSSKAAAAARCEWINGSRAEYVCRRRRSLLGKLEDRKYCKTIESLLPYLTAA